MWLIAIGIGVVLTGLISGLNSSAGQARANWNRKYESVQKSIEWHRENIASHISNAQQIYDYHRLVELHYSSVKIADEAYSLLQNVTTTIFSINKTLHESKINIGDLVRKRSVTLDKQERETITNEIQEIKDFRHKLFSERDELVAQKENFLSEVRKFNNQTHMLKERIRDNTGQKGRDWYSRLESRKQLRKKV